MPNEKIRKAYDLLSDAYELEQPYEEFESRITQSPEARRKAYDLLSDAYEMEQPFEEFEQLMTAGYMEHGQADNTGSPQPAVKQGDMEGKTQPAASEQVDSAARVVAAGGNYTPRSIVPSNRKDWDAINERASQMKQEELAKKEELERQKAEAAENARQVQADVNAQLRPNQREERRAKWKSLGEALLRSASAAPGMTATSAAVAGGMSPSQKMAVEGSAEAFKEYGEHKLVAEALDESIDYVNAVANEKGVGRGAWDFATRIGTFDFGYSDIVKGLTLQQLAEKAESGEQLSEEEERVLDMVAQATYLTQLVQDGVKMGYNVGASLPQSLGFMVGIALNPASGLGQQMMKRAAKKYGERAFKTMATRALGDVAEMGIATLTTGSGRVLADAIDRVNGDVTYDITPEGYIAYGGQQNQETLWKAAAKAFGTNFIENYTEALGEYFSPLGNMLGDLTSKNLRRMNLGGLVDFINAIPQSQWGKMVGQFMEATKFNGVVGEILEEEIGMFLEPVFVGDSTLAENFNIWSDDPEIAEKARDNQLTTILSCALMSGMLYGVQGAGVRGKLNRELAHSDSEGRRLLGEDNWNDIRSLFDATNGDVEKLERQMKDIVYGRELNNEQRKAIVDYAAKMVQTNQFNASSDAAKQEMTDTARELTAAYDAGYRMATMDVPQHFRGVRNDYLASEDAILEYDKTHLNLNLLGIAHNLKDADMATREQVLQGLTTEESDLVKTYLACSERFKGLYQGTADAIDADKMTFQDMIKPAIVTNEAGEQVVRTATAAYGEQVYVVGGEGKVSYILDGQGVKRPFPTDQLKDIQEITIEELTGQMDKAIEDSWRAKLEKYSQHNEQTKEPEIGMVLGNGDGDYVITDMGEGWATIQEATTDKEGNIVPKPDGKSRDVSKDWILAFQDQIYDNRDAMDGKPVPSSIPAAMQQNADDAAEQQQTIRDRSQVWSDATGVNVRLYDKMADITNRQVLEALTAGRTVVGWYDTNSGEVGFYTPYITDISEMDRTFIHEVVAHKGMRMLLGEDKYNELCQTVWDELMNDEDRNGFLSRVSHLKLDEAGMQKAAADEYIAYFAERMQLSPTDEERTIWERIVQMVKSIMDRLGLGESLTTEDLSELLQASLARFRQEAAAEQAAQPAAEEQKTPSALESIPAITDKEGNITDYAWSQAPDAETALAAMREAGYSDEDIRIFSDIQTKELKKKGQALEKKAPKSLPQQREKREAIAAVQQEQEFWNAVIAAMDAEIATSQAEKEALDAYGSDFQDILDAVNQMINETDFVSLVAYGAARAKYIWADSDHGTKGFASHMFAARGNKRGERMANIGWLANRDKGGKYPEEVAESIFADLPDNIKEGHDEMEALDIVIDTIRTANHPATVIRDIYARLIQKQQEDELREQQRLQEEEERQQDAYARDYGFANYQEMLTFEELWASGEDVVEIPTERLENYYNALYGTESNAGVGSESQGLVQRPTGQDKGDGRGDTLLPAEGSDSGVVGNGTASAETGTDAVLPGSQSAGAAVEAPYTIQGEKTMSHPASLRAAYESGNKGDITKAEKAVGDFIMSSDNQITLDVTVKDFTARKKKAEKGSAEQRMCDFVIKKCRERINELKKAKESQSTIQGLEKYSENELNEVLSRYVEAEMMLVSSDEFKLKGIKIVGSRMKGTAKEGSDLDVLVEYEGSMREDEAFNMLNGEEGGPHFGIDGIRVDFNPIKADDSGTIEQWLKRNGDYDKNAGDTNTDKAQAAIEALEGSADEARDFIKGTGKAWRDKPLTTLAEAKWFMNWIGYDGGLSKIMTDNSGRKFVKYKANGVVTPNIYLGETTPREILKQFLLYGNVMNVSVPTDIQKEFEREQAAAKKTSDALWADDREQIRNILTEAGIPFVDVIDSERGSRIIFTDRKNDNGNYLDYLDVSSADQTKEDIEHIRVRAGKYNPDGPTLFREIDNIRERAIKDGTFMKAPNGKPTRLTERQWLLARTRAFRKWFGNWLKPMQLEKLRKSDNISIKGDEITPSDDLKEYRKNALEYGKNLRGEYTNADTGNVIRLTGTKRGGLKEILEHDYKDVQHLQSIAAIPQIIEKGIFIETLPNDDKKNKPNIAEYDYYVCGLNIGGEDYTVKAVIGVDSNGQKYYDHKLTSIEKGKLLDELASISISGQTDLSSEETQEGAVGSNPTAGEQESIKPSLSEVKDKRLLLILQNNFSKVLDENGEPMVMYHGTDLMQVNQGKPFYTFYPDSHFGTLSQAKDILWNRTADDIEHKPKTYEVFLNIRNPKRVDDMPEDWSASENEYWDPVIRQAKSEGYDGIIYENKWEGEAVSNGQGNGEDSYVIFKSNQAKSATENSGEFSRENDDIRFRTVNERASLMGAHNISEDKLRKVLKQGGLANPSMAIVDTDKYIHEGYGDISLIPYSSTLDAGRKSGVVTYSGDAYSPSYPYVTHKLTGKGEKKIDEMAKRLAKGDKMLEEYLSSRLYDYAEGNGTRLAGVYLADKGYTPSVIMEQGLHTHEEYERVKDIIERNNHGERTEVDFQRVLDILLSERLKSVEEAEGRIKNETLRKAYRKKVYDDYKARITDENGKLNFAPFDSYLEAVRRSENLRNNPRMDKIKMDGAALDEVSSKGLSDDFWKWVDGLFTDEEWPELLFNGYDADGRRKYIPNTLQNASRLMNKQNKINADDWNGWNATKAALLKRMRTLSDIRRLKDNLRTQEDYEKEIKELSDGWQDIVSELADMQVIDDNRFSNVDYAENRLQEAILENNPVEYLNKEYRYKIDKDSDFAKKLDAAIKNMKAAPAKYFEAKFSRPVYLNEFKYAIVPDDISDDVRSGLENAGLQLTEYRHGNSEDFKNKVRKATEDDSDVRFRETTPRNTSLDQVLFRIAVNHNSPYLLKKADGRFVDPSTGERLGFDTRFMSSGEGVQAHGWGSYFSVNDIRRYADKEGNFTWKGLTYDDMYDRLENETSNARKGEYAAAMHVINALNKGGNIDQAIKEWSKTAKFWRDFYSDKEIGDAKERFNKFDAELKAYDKIKTEDIEGELHTEHHHYDVSIPRNNGDNYLEEMQTLTKRQRRKIASAVRKLDGEPEKSVKYQNYKNGWNSLADMIEREQWAYLEVRDRLVQAFGGKVADEERLSKFMESVGFVGVHYNGRRDGECYVIFNDKDAHIENHTMFREVNLSQEVFVSNAQRAVENIKQDKATPQQWLAMIQKQGGIKAGEDKWLRLSQWLQEQTVKTLTKQEVLGYIGENKIQIEEQLYSERPSDARDLEVTYPGWYQAFWEDVYEGPGGERIEWRINNLEKAVELYNANNSVAVQIDIDENGEITDDEFDELLDWADRAYLNVQIAERGINPTHLSYSTEGLDNKREIALWVPNIEPWNESDPIHFGDAGSGRAISWIRFGDARGEVQRTLVDRHVEEFGEPIENANHNLVYHPKGKDSFSSKEYVVYGTIRSGEKKYVLMVNDSNEQIGPFDSLDEAKEALNIWYNTYPKYKTSSDRILVIDEIQSKRHQEGREKGYKDDFKQSELDKAREEAHAYGNVLYEKYGKPGEDFLEKATDEEKARFEELNKRVSDLTRLRASGIPGAPFEKNWSELAMKRMLRLAAEEGYDRIAWTTGEQQSERYNIGGYLRSIKRRESDDINEMEFALYLNGDNSQYITTDKSGNVVYSLVSEFRDRNLTDIIGKELAEKALALKENEELDTDDITISNSGMATFYDKMLVNFMNKYGKQWGVKVENIDIPGVSEGQWENAGDGLTMHSVAVTPEMKRDVMEGQVMFREANSKNKQPDQEEPSDVLFRLSNRDRETVGKWLEKRQDLTPEERQKMLDYFDTLEDKKLQLAAGWWFTKGTVRFPEDMPKVEQAVKVAGIAKVDPMQYSSPMELINTHANIEIKEKPVNPDEVSTLHKVKELPDGIVIYDVDNSEESRQNMRRIIDTHYGKESSPWCLLQGDGEGGLTSQSKEYWDYYNSYPKQVAFKNGKLLAFSANRGSVRWWDRMDEPHVGIPVEGKIPNDELGRSGVIEYDPADGEATVVRDMWRGNPDNGPFEIYYDTGQLRRRSTRKDTFDVGPVEVWHMNGQKSAEFTNNELGNTEGEFKTWHPNGQLHTTGTMMNGRPVGVHETYFDNGQLEMKSVYPDKWRGNEHPIEPRERFYPNGQIRSIEPYDKDGIKNGTETEWFEDGKKEVEVEYINNEPKRTTRWFQNGDLESTRHWDENGYKTGVWEKYRWDWDKKKSVPEERATYKNGAKNGVYEEYYTNGQMKMQTNFKDGNAEGLTETWNEDGKMFLRFVQKDRKEIGHEYYDYDKNEVVQMYTIRNGAGEPHNYVRRLPMEGYTPLTEEELSTYPDWAKEEIMSDPTMFREVTDPLLLDVLESGAKQKGYRTVVVNENGNFGSPMAGRLGKKGSKSKSTSPFRLGVWEEAEENPDIATDDGKVNLIKPGKKGSVGGVDYNPYIHIRPTSVNKQFTQAWSRPELVYIETEYPERELTSGYKADKAKLSVGRHSWNGGELILSRWDKPARIVPWDEVADQWEKEFKEGGVTFDIVAPQMLDLLADRGVEILPPKKAAGKAAMQAYENWHNGRGPEGGGTRFRITPEMDAEYEQAYKDGDEKKAMQMVKDAFKLKYPDSKVVDEKGEPLVVYHGTPHYRFNAFAEPGSNLQGLIWTAVDKKYAETYAASDEEVRESEEEFGDANVPQKDGIYKLLVNIKNPVELGNIDDSVGSDTWDAIAKKFGLTPNELFDRNGWNGSRYEASIDQDDAIYELTREDKFVRLLKENGYDGVTAREGGPGVGGTFKTYGAVSGNQVKSAEPFTFDDEGKLIPLSKRFDNNNWDIRFRESRVEEAMATLFGDDEMRGGVDNSKENTIFVSNNRNNERKSDNIQQQASTAEQQGTGRREAAVSQRAAQQSGDVIKPLRKLEEGETCYVERKLSEAGEFGFVGTDRIESVDDVAFIFRKLESKAVENSFIVFVKDGKATILHVGMGRLSSTQVDTSGLTVMMNNLKPDSVFFVHNHPSGNVESSRQDRDMWYGLKKVMGNKLQPGIIIDTTRGIYGVYEKDALSNENREFADKDGDIKIPTYRFDELAFSKDYKPQELSQVRTSRDVAQFVASHRLGERDKISVLCLNQNAQVLGNFFLPYTGFDNYETIKKIARECAYYAGMTGAPAVILYGTGVDPRASQNEANLKLAVVNIKNFLEEQNIALVEIIGDATGGKDWYYSYADNGRLMEPQVEYGKRQELQQAEQDTDTNPTDGQKEAGNYKKGHVRLFGMDLSIEQPKGSVRRGTDPDGKEWEQEMHNTYGYIRGTMGRDKDHIDVFLGDNLSSDKVFVVDQRNVQNGSFDEHKVMLGFDDIEAARDAYNNNYEDGWTGLGAITETSLENFKAWAFKEGRRVQPFNQTEGDGSVLFRQREPSEYKRIEDALGVAAVRYERAMDEAGKRMGEVMSDSMRSVKELQDAIAAETGSPIRDFENAYWAAIQYSSRNKAMQDAYHKKFYRPLLEEVYNLTKDAKDREKALDELNAYLMAKHGLERNDKFAMRDAERDAKEQLPEESRPIEEHDKWEAEFERLRDSLYEKYRRRDYSGLTALFEKKKVTEAEIDAQLLVDSYERDHDTTELWQLINTATKETLRTSLQGGIITQEKYIELATMFDNYVPLRGFEETTSDDVYGYYGTVNSPYNTAIKKAYGRRSLADSPLATIGNIADSEIMRANRNRIYMSALSLAENHHTGLMSVSEVMFKRDPATNQWEIALPDLSDVDTPEEVARKMDDFRKWFAVQLIEDAGNYRLSSEMAKVPYKVINKSALDEHQIIAIRGGKQYVITVNGNPRAAQALAGKTNPDSSPALNWLAPFNRFLAGVFTQYNPSFVLRNLTRDGIYTNAMVWAKEGNKYALSFNKNWSRVLANMASLLSKYKGELLDDSLPIERYFREFIDNGGETGYTQLRSVKDYKKIMTRELKDIASVSPAAQGRKVLAVLGEAVENMNRWAEGISRFAAFLTSREQGRSVVRSVEDAKEISVNFNKKGSGTAALTDKDRDEKLLLNVARVSQLGRELFVFFNAGVQGMANFTDIVKNNPQKAVPILTGLFLGGAALAMMNGGGGDDDDEKEYYNLPEYIRRSNICLKAGKHWMTIPMPIELRCFYGLGELAYSVMSGNEFYEGKELAYEVASQLTQILPIDFLEGNQGTMAFVPSAVKPIVEAYWLNQDWTGTPIYNESPFNENDPAWRKAFKSTSPVLVAAARKINELTGGNVGRSGVIDINPARVEHLFEGYLGGVGTIMNQAYKTGRALTGDLDMREVRNIPVVSGFMRDADGKAGVRAENARYHKINDMVDNIFNEDRRLRQLLAEKEIVGYDYDEKAIQDARERLQELRGSKEWEFAQQWRSMDKARTAAREGRDEEAFNKLTKEMNDIYIQFKRADKD